MIGFCLVVGMRGMIGVCACVFVVDVVVELFVFAIVVLLIVFTLFCSLPVCVRGGWYLIAFT